MAKRGYDCKCGGFKLRRGEKTRKQYAAAKREHAQTCDLLKVELEKSARANRPTKGE
jgi:hypothetical protein